VAAMPLPDLVGAFSDAPEEVAKAAERLDYNQVVVVGVALDRPAPDQHWVYVPGRSFVKYVAAYSRSSSNRSDAPGTACLAGACLSEISRGRYLCLATRLRP